MKIKNLLYWLLVVLLAVTMVVSGFFVFRYIADSQQQKQEYDEIKNTKPSLFLNGEKMVKCLVLRGFTEVSIEVILDKNDSEI